MDDLFSQIECRSKVDSIVMRILRSATDKAHEKLQSRDGPIEFLHQRSTFYELASILVEGGLGIVQEEEMDVLEGGRDKILSDLMEIRHWLQGRIQDMKHLIVEKDRELKERFENESNLKKALEMKEMEVHGKSEPGLLKNESRIGDQLIHTEGDISELKSSVDQQVWNIKQKLEDEEKILSSETRRITSPVSSPNLSFEFVYKEINQDSIIGEENSCGFSKIRTKNELSDQNVLIKRMSSDIDILKETLDQAFGKMQKAEVLPLEKQWRCSVEKEIESILVKGFIHDLDAESRKKSGFLKDENWLDFIDEMRNLYHELKSFCNSSNKQGRTLGKPSCTIRRTSSEPLLEIDCIEVDEEDMGSGGSKFVAKMVKNHEYIIRKQSKESNCLRRDGQGEDSQLTKRDGDINSLERRIQDAITRLNNLIRRNHGFGEMRNVSGKRKTQEKRKIPKSDSKTKKGSTRLEEEVGRLKEERDGLFLQISMMEETYQILVQGIAKDFNVKNSIKNDFEEMNLVKERRWKILCDDQTKAIPETRSSDHSQIVSSEETTLNKFSLDSHFSEMIESRLKEEIYTVFFKEMTETLKSERDAFATESLVREDIYQFVIREAVNESHACFMREAEVHFHETPRSRRLMEMDSCGESTPRSRKLHSYNGEESFIQKLDSSLRCLEAEEDLMLRVESEIKEHSVNNSLVILNCEEMDERDAIEWLLTDDESTFGSASEKLERALQQLYTSKELLIELSLEVSDELEEDDCEEQLNNTPSIECERSHLIFEEEECERSHLIFEEEDEASNIGLSDIVLVPLTRFQGLIADFEQKVKENLDDKFSRLGVLEHDVDALFEPFTLIRRRKLLYKKAFISRCHNLKLAESEVDLLGDQVEALLGLLERIYGELNQNYIFAKNVGVSELMKLIREKLDNADICVES